VADNQRIEDLRRRVQKDPASIAFAQLAEECRRAGQHQEAVDVCSAGLAIHPGYLSARVTLGRALIELNDLDAALNELNTVLKSAPENLAAIRGVAEIHHRRGELAAALAQYRAALALARNDPDLQQTVAELARQVEPPAPPASADGLSFEQMQSEFLKLAPPPSVAPRAKDTEGEPPSAATATEDTKDDTPDKTASAAVVSAESANAVLVSAAAPAEAAQEVPDAAIPVPEPAASDAPSASVSDAAATGRESLASLSGIAEGEVSTALQTIAALEQWLDAIHVARAERGA
jgi:tetratricopeptide (TPR) repeat protein